MQWVGPNAIDVLTGSPKVGLSTLALNEIPDWQHNNDISAES
jgi:hypothetical protein